MLKERVFVPFISSTQPLQDATQIISDLRSEMQRLQAQLVDERYKRTQAEAHVSILQRNRNKPIVIPRGDIEIGYWCNVCGCHLQGEWTYCTDCGGEIDWNNNIHDAEPEFAYDLPRKDAQKMYHDLMQKAGVLNVAN